MNVCLSPCPIVFDLDGTLIDSAPDIHACVNTVLDQHRAPLLTLDQVRSFIGGGVDVLWQLFATGWLIIVAVAIDQWIRKISS